MPCRTLLSLARLAISGILMHTMLLIITQAILRVLLVMVMVMVVTDLAVLSKLELRQLIRICNLVQTNGEIAGHLRVVESLVSRAWRRHLHMAVMMQVQITVRCSLHQASRRWVISFHCAKKDSTVINTPSKRSCGH
jgi:hypothetical protein